jgi:predicted AlkP superfamily pyrophosphatase or phosphodiesterase
LFGLDFGKQTLPNKIYKKYVNDKQKIVLFLTDGFGYEQCKEASQNTPFLKKLFDNHAIYPITSVFPSTTAASLTTLATGLAPQGHGLFEWFLYIEELDQIIQTLPFSHFGKKAKSDELISEGVSPKILLDAKTIYEKLLAEGIKSYNFINEDYASSAYSTVLFRGSKTIIYKSLSDLTVKLRDFLTNNDGPLFCYVYWTNIDTAGHNYGPKSEQYFLEVKTFFDNLQEPLITKLKQETLDDTLFLLTADHGQISVNPEETIYLNNDGKLLSFLEISKNNKRILPYGNTRDCFLKIKEEKVDEAIQYLKEKYHGFALILKTEEMVKAGLFGLGQSSERFLKRVGNVMILPYKNNTIGYEYVKGEPFILKGHHGGLSEEEMLIPFGIARFSELL